MTKREVNRTINELKEDIRLVGVNKRQFDRKLKSFEDTHFPGRIETNEIKTARKEQKRLADVIDELQKELKGYERIKKGL